MIRDALGYPENSPESLQIQIRSKRQRQNITEPPCQEHLQQVELNLNPTLDTLSSSTAASPNPSQAFAQRRELDFSLPLDLSEFDLISPDTLRSDVRPNHSSLQNFTQRPELDFLLPPDPSTFEFGTLSPQEVRPDGLLGGSSQAFAQRSEFNFTLPTGTFGLGLSDVPPDTLLSSANIGHQVPQDFVRRPEFDFNLPLNSPEISPQAFRQALQVNSNGTTEQHSFSPFPQRSEFDFSLPKNMPELTFTNPSPNNTSASDTTLEYASPQILVQQPEVHQVMRYATSNGCTPMPQFDSNSPDSSRTDSNGVTEQSASRSSFLGSMDLGLGQTCWVPSATEHCRDQRVPLQAASQYTTRGIM